MNVAASTQSAERREHTLLDARTPARNMRLMLSSRCGELTVGMFHQKSKYTSSQIAFAWAQAEQCRISKCDDGRCSLWVGNASFEIQPSEVEKISTTFGIAVKGVAA